MEELVPPNAPAIPEGRGEKWKAELGFSANQLYTSQ